jgi:hypothetical protein
MLLHPNGTRGWSSLSECCSLRSHDHARPVLMAALALVTLCAGNIADAVFNNADAGTLITFDAPRADEGAVGSSINAMGTLSDAGGVIHRLLLAPHDPATSSPASTQPSSINPAGTVTGWYADASGTLHGDQLTARTHGVDSKIAH